MKKLFLLAPAVYPIPLFKVAVALLVPLLRKLGFRYWMHVAGDVKREDGFELGYGKTALTGLLALSACMEATQKLLPDVTADVLIFQSRTDHEVPAKKAGGDTESPGLPPEGYHLARQFFPRNTARSRFAARTGQDPGRNRLISDVPTQDRVFTRRI